MTQVGNVLQIFLVCFNPHTHEGCDILLGCKDRHAVKVSIHTPTKGVTPLAQNAIWWKKFQSTHPRRVWHDKPFCYGFCLSVSIHTPTKGVTLNTNLLTLFSKSFNPHTHEGCDKWKQLPRPSPDSFNPHTHEGCDPRTRMTLELRISFNPHTHEGCDEAVLLPTTLVRSFNPHTHEGCDKYSIITNGDNKGFNPHTHEGCDLMAVILA